MKPYLDLAQQLADKGQFTGAEVLWKYCLAQGHESPKVVFNVGRMVQAQATTSCRKAEAAGWYERLICDPSASLEDKSDALQNLGCLMHQSLRPDKACIAFNLALQIDPENEVARRNLAVALEQCGRWEECDAEYVAILKKDWNDAGAHFSRGMIALLLGDYMRGWAEYEWRFKVDTFPTKPFETQAQCWHGEDLDGKTITITHEQGFGDCIMGIRYAREIKRRWPNATVWWYGHSALRQLMKCADGVDEAFDAADEQGRMLRGETPIPYHFHCPVLSLPHRFVTTPDTVPAGRYIAVPNDRITLGDNSKKRIGIVWAGSPRHGKDAWRSIPPESFQPIVDAHPDCQFYSLQVGPRQHEVLRLNRVVYAAAEIVRIGDWTATAEVLQQLDLLISVDTACVHLAGAMGVPVWMLCPSSPDFRWGLSGETTPWYDSMRIFRQPKEGDWQSVLNRVNESL